jgi:hypothetical protein
MPFWSHKKETPPPPPAPAISADAASLLCASLPAPAMNPLDELSQRFNEARERRITAIADMFLFPPSAAQGYDRIIEKNIRQWILHTQQEKRAARARQMQENMAKKPVAKMQDNNIPPPELKN